jgi:hypothetical protein
LAGIPTKKTRFDDAGAFYTDDEYEDNCQRISVAVDTVLSMAAGPEYTEVVLPEGGFGTGLAQLEAKAERTFAFLQTQVERIKAAFPLASAEAVGESGPASTAQAVRPAVTEPVIAPFLCARCPPEHASKQEGEGFKFHRQGS